MKKIKLLSALSIAAIPLALTTTTSCTSEKVDDVYRDINLDEDWTFRLNDIEKEQTINLPHDFSIIQDFKHSNRELRKRQTSGTTGFLPGGIGYYHKDFVLPKKNNPTVILNFDGAYNDTIVTVNGQIVGNNRYGYNPFAFDISNYVIADGQTVNKLDVIVKHEYVTCSRWYPGSGIYRDVKISVLDKVHVTNYGTYVTTPNLKEEVGKDVTVNVEVDVQNSSDRRKTVYLKNRVVDYDGNPVTEWSSTKSTRIEEQETFTFNSTLKVNNPKLWSSENPNLYFVETQVVAGKHIVDQYKTRFGFRYFDFDETGFYVNGQKTKLKGVCLHHDQGALGAAAYNDAIYRQLTIMKAMGMNAIRTSHNCPDEDLLRMCDELGMYVMDEAFDGWEFAKTQHDFSEVWKKEIGYGNQLIDSTPTMQWHTYVMRSMIKRDRNCPSIFMWSFGNELHEGEWHDDDVDPIRKQEITNEMLGYAEEFRNIVLDIDHASANKRWFGIALERDPLDEETKDWPKCQIGVNLHNEGGVLGFNYGSADQTRAALETFKRVYGSETASANNSRGMYSKIEFDEDDENHAVPSTDTQGTTTASEALWRTLYFDGYGGQFVWTGFDYIGEPSPWCWNCEEDPVEEVEKHWPYPNSSYYGIVDTCGFEKDSYYLYRAHLRNDDTTLHLLGSLNDQNMFRYPEVQPPTDFPAGFTPIDIYTNAPYVLITDQNDQQLAKVTRYDTATSREWSTYYTFKAESLNEDRCKIQDTKIKQDSGHDLYSNILVDPEGITEIKAKAYIDPNFTQPIEKTVGQWHLNTKDDSSISIDCQPNKQTITADGKSLSYITVDLLDANGNLITDFGSQKELNVSWSGQGKVLGVDNGYPAWTEKWQNPAIFHPDLNKAEIKTYAGKALIIVCSNKTPGTITITIQNGSETKQITIETN